MGDHLLALVGEYSFLEHKKDKNATTWQCTAVHKFQSLLVACGQHCSTFGSQQEPGWCDHLSGSWTSDLSRDVRLGKMLLCESAKAFLYFLCWKPASLGLMVFLNFILLLMFFQKQKLIKPFLHGCQCNSQLCVKCFLMHLTFTKLQNLPSFMGLATVSYLS